MKNVLEFEKNKRKSIALFSEYNGLSISLLEKLLANFFRVTIFCVKKKLWFENAPYLKDNLFLSFSSFEKANKTFDFLIFSSVFFDNFGERSEKEIIRGEIFRIETIFSSIEVTSKRIFLLPYFVFDNLSRDLVEIYNQEVKQGVSFENAVIYLGNLVGPRMILSDRDELSIILRGLIKKEKVQIPVPISCEIKPSKVASVSREIIKILLADDLDYFRTLISGPSLFLKEWLDELKNNFGDFDYSFSKKTLAKVSGVCDRELIIDSNVDLKFLKQTINWFKDNAGNFYFEENLVNKSSLQSVQGLEENKRSANSNRIKELLWKAPSKLNIHNLNFREMGIFFGLKINDLKSKIKTRGIKRNSFTKTKLPDKAKILSKIEKTKLSFLQKYLIFSFSTVLTFLLIPALSLLVSLVSFYFGQKLVRNGSFSYAKYAFSLEEKTADFSLSQFYFYSDMPLVGKAFVVPAKVADISLQVSEIALLAIDGAQKTLFLIGKSFNGQEVPLDSYSQNLILIFDSIYKKSSFLDGQLREIKNSWPFTYLSSYIDRIDIPRRREEIQAAKTVFSLIDKVLGKDKERNYLVLFQNNMELRPTGGFIGSFAIVGFNKGAMTKFEIYDVYSADGQLKGYVAPPWQLKEYLNQPAWYLRDSNWDPDFTVSAQRAEWFLDKSMNIQVDGVIAIDLSFARDVVNVFDSVYVPDFDKRIDAKNFYEVVQYEAEKDFFPGSRQKENFLLALSRSLLDEFKSAGNKQMVGILESFYQNLNRRHIQVFLHEVRLQEKIDDLRWSGTLRQPACSLDNCLSDWASLIEANLGVNKANYFISRVFKLKVDVNQDVIRRSLEVDFTNKAQVFMGDKGKYRVYLRLLLPINTKIDKVVLGEQGNANTIDFKEELVNGIKEVGFLLEINPGESKKVFFEWQGGGVDLAKNGEYRFYLRKQAGIDSFPFFFEINFPSNFVIGADRLFQLTKKGNFTYNVQDLSEDFLGRFYW